MTSKPEEDTKSIAVFTSHMIEERIRAMTRKEAIEILKKELEITKAIDKRFGDFPEHAQALELAISSLETDEAYQLEYEQPTTKNDLGVDTVSRQAVLDLMIQKWGDNFSGDDAMQESIDAIKALPSVTPQEPVLEKINKMKSEIADSLEFWDYSPNNNPLARDMLETLTNFLGDMRG